MAYSDEELSRIQEDLTRQYISEPLTLEETIKETAERVAKDLAYGPEKSSFEFLEEDYKAAVKRDMFKKKIFVAISNETHRELAGNKYSPYMVDCDIDNNFSYYENMKAVVEAFLRHVSGTIEPEVLDD